MILSFMCIPAFNDWSWHADSDLLSDYGDFIGGFVGAIFSLAGFCLISLTLNAQQKEINTQKKAYERESFESTFFNLLNVQQNITNDLKAYFWRPNVGTDRLITIEKYSVRGREFFSIAVKERKLIKRSLSSKEYLGIYEEPKDHEVEGWLVNIEEQSRMEPNPSDYLDKEVRKLHRRSQLQLINLIYGIDEEKWKNGRAKTGVDRVKFVYELFFDKYRYVVGHYFRNLYHVVKFVDDYEKSQCTKAESGEQAQQEIRDRCNRYAGFIQAQMSSYELALLHDDSVIFSKMRELVEKYHLIENCSSGDLIDNNSYVNK